MIYLVCGLVSILGAILGAIVAPKGTLRSFFRKPNNLFAYLKVALLALPVVYGGIAIQLAIFSYFKFTQDESTSIKNENILLVLISISLMPVFEELIYRGYLEELFLKYDLRKIGVYFSSLAFGISHPHFGATIPMGFILLYLRKRSASLWSSIFFHSLINSAHYLVVHTLTKIGGDSGASEVEPDDTLFFFGAGVVLITIGSYGFRKILKSLLEKDF